LSFCQRLALHLQLPLRVLLEDLGVTLTEELRHPLVGHAAGAEARRVRRAQIVDAKVRAEERSMPGSQVITYLDVAWIARRFRASYRLTVSRLLGQGRISEADSTRLLKTKLVELAGEWLTLFSSRAATPHPGYAISVLSDLNAEHAHMAVEAYRRG
jgi:hypothetical protein